MGIRRVRWQERERNAEVGGWQEEEEQEGSGWVSVSRRRVMARWQE